MARYIDAELALELHDGELWAWDVPDLKEFLAEVPTADVVPKSEVEKIFEEIERFLYMHFRFCKEESGNDDTKYLEGRLELNTQMQDLIAELKKKYPEEQNDT